MNLSNPLPPIWQAYKTAQDSFRIAKRAIKTDEPKARQRLLQRTDLETKTTIDAEHLIRESENESDALFVLALWATFERFLRDYLQHKGQALLNVTPSDLAGEMYLYFHKEVEFWQPDEILNFLKLSLLKHKTQLAGHAKVVYNYRNWIAHGKGSAKTVSPVTPHKAYETLAEIVNILLTHP
jgi:hypothetical protein